MDKLTLASFLDPSHLELILLPTEQCNFRCTYCYEDFEIGQMKDVTVQAIKALISKRLPKLRKLTVSWFGGEPLMAKAIVHEINAFAQKQCAEHQVRFVSNMTTNAFGLDFTTFEKLLTLGVNDFQISMDGDEEEHNKTRKLMSGRGSFEKIWRNLLALRASQQDFFIVLRLHIHQKNVDSIQQLLAKINAEFGNDSRFSIFMKAVGNWGGESVKELSLVKDAKTIISEFDELLDSWGWFDIRPHDKAEARFKPCYAARPNSLVVRADGRLAKCTVAFSDDRNTIGQINHDGTVTMSTEKMQAFMRGFQTADKAALHCPMKGMPKAEEIKVIKFEKKAHNIPAEAEAAEAA